MFCSLYCSPSISFWPPPKIQVYTDFGLTYYDHSYILTHLINKSACSQDFTVSAQVQTHNAMHKSISPLVPALLIIITTTISKHWHGTAEELCTQKHSSGFSSPPLWAPAKKTCHKYQNLFLLRASKTLWWVTRGKKERSTVSQHQTV